MKNTKEHACTVLWVSYSLLQTKATSTCIWVRPAFLVQEQTFVASSKADTYVHMHNAFPTMYK